MQVFGEITSHAQVDYESVARQVCRDIGYTSDVSGPWVWVLGDTFAAHVVTHV